MTDPPRDGTAWRYLAPAGVVLLTLGAYAGIFDNGFYKDDYLWLTAGRDDMHGAGVLLHQTVGFFRPLTNVLFWSSERIAPGNGAFYNLTNLGIHAVNSLLVLFLLRALFSSRVVALAGALVFACAHNHSGAVLWVSARTTLVATALLLASMLLATGDGHTRRRRLAALVACGLALATKETAVTGVGLAALLYLRSRRGSGRGLDRGVLAGYAALTLAYLAVRMAVMGPVIQDNWGPGIHGAGNLLGAILYSYYPWVLAHLAGPSAALRDSPVAMWPEVVGALIPVLLTSAAPPGSRRRDMTLAMSWVAVALLPSVFFNFRFLGEYSHVHNRYYYLAGVGVAASIGLLIDWVWESALPRRTARSFATAILVLVIAANVYALGAVESFWGDSNRRFATVVGRVVDDVTRQDQFDTVVVTGLEGWQPYFARAVQYRSPKRSVVFEHGEAIAGHAPCLVVELTRSPDGRVSYRLRELR